MSQDTIPVDLTYAEKGDIYYHERLELFYEVIFVSDEGVLFKRFDSLGEKLNEVYSHKKSDIKLVYTNNDISVTRNQLESTKMKISQQIGLCEYEIREKLKGRRNLKTFKKELEKQLSIIENNL